MAGHVRQRCGAEGQHQAAARSPRRRRGLAAITSRQRIAAAIASSARFSRARRRSTPSRCRGRGRTCRRTASGVLGRDAELARMRRAGSSAHCAASGRSCSSPVSPASARRRWSTRCCEQAAAAERHLGGARPMPRAVRRRRSVPAGARCLLAAGRDAGRRTHRRAAAPARPGMAARVALAHSGRPSARRCGSRSSGATRERMLREMAEAIEAITAEAPLILVLEDLHWSDYSTLDLVAYLARRRDPRAADGDRHLPAGRCDPRRASAESGQARTAGARPVSGAAARVPRPKRPSRNISTVEFPGTSFPKRLARLIHRRTEGNPLFMVNLVEYLIDEADHRRVGRRSWHAAGRACQTSSRRSREHPATDREADRAAQSRTSGRVLEGASVVGMECSSVAIAAGLDEPTEWVEEHAKRWCGDTSFCRRRGSSNCRTAPSRRDTSSATCCISKCRTACCRRCGASQIHRRIGQSGEAIYGDRVGEIAAELAMHFEQGRDAPRAVKYLLLAAENATHRSAHHEAAALARRGLQALSALPPTPSAIGRS